MEPAERIFNRGLEPPPRPAIIGERKKHVNPAKAELTYADVTPKDMYSNRRQFLRDLGIAGAATALAGEGILSLASPSLTGVCELRS